MATSQAVNEAAERHRAEAPPLGDSAVYRYAPALRPPPAPQIAYGMRRSRLSLAVVLFASHLLAALAGAYVAAKAAERGPLPAEACPVRATTWL